MNDHPFFQTDALIAEDIDAYLEQHQHKSPVDHGLPAAQPHHPGSGRLCPAAARPAGKRPQENDGMIGRIIWFGILAAVAVLVTFLQIDKQSEKSPQLAAVVPAPLRNYALEPVARTSIRGDDAARALADARQLVARRPVPAEYLILLAAAQGKAGQNEAAFKTIQIAGKRGWRDPAAQEAVLRIALAAGDKAEAARRYAALFLRRGTPDALLQEIGPAVLDEQGGIGQQTLTAIVLGGERWRATFLRRGAQVMPPAAFAAITQASIKQGAAFDCQLLDQSIGVLAARDQAAADVLRAAAQTGACPPAAMPGNAAL
jgi:hypothetical protein